MDNPERMSLRFNVLSEAARSVANGIGSDPISEAQRFMSFVEGAQASTLGVSDGDDRLAVDSIGTASGQEYYNRIRTNEVARPMLGLATTLQLLDELRARAELNGYGNYRTVDETDAVRPADNGEGPERGYVDQDREAPEVMWGRGYVHPAGEGPNARQVGGDHYRRGGTQQHWDFVRQTGQDYYQGNATKYISRARFKGSAVENYEKALHYIDKAEEVGSPLLGALFGYENVMLFGDANNLNTGEVFSIWLILMGRWDDARERVQRLVGEARRARSQASGRVDIDKEG